MVRKAKKTEAVASKEAAAPAVNQNDVVNVTNISDRVINTSKGSIGPGEHGKATVAEARSLNKFLKV